MARVVSQADGVNRRVFQLGIKSREAMAKLIAGLNNAEECGASLKALRNKLLGHEALKGWMVTELGIVDRLLPFLENDVRIDWQREAIVILGSIAYGGRAEMTALLEVNVPTLLLQLIIRRDDEKMRESAMRALRTIYRQGGTPRELPYREDVLPKLVELMESAGERTREYCTIVLASCCEDKRRQEALRERRIIALAMQMLMPKETLPFATM